ncbi:MAG TPA: anti-sigma B factor RsbW [Bacilli bacterium]
MFTTIQLTIPANAEYLHIVRLTLYGIASKAGFSFEEIEDMKVAVAEACNNSILHAYPEQQAGSVEVSFELDEEGMCIRIKDKGESFDYELASKKAVSHHDKKMDELRAGGLGLYMMQALMDKVQVISKNGTEVLLTKFFKKMGAA